MNLSSLPVELVGHFLRFLDLGDQLRVRATCVGLHAAVRGQSRCLLRIVGEDLSTGEASLGHLVKALPQITEAIASRVASLRPSQGCQHLLLLHRIQDGPHAIRLLFTLQSHSVRSATPASTSPSIVVQISSKCTALLSLPLNTAFATLSEGIGAHRGDCTSLHAIRPTCPPTATPIYATPDYEGSTSPTRHRLSTTLGARSLLARYLNPHTQAVLELKFRGGGDIFLMERYSLSEKDPVVVCEISNVPRVDSVQMDQAMMGGSPVSFGFVMDWIVHLWDDVVAGRSRAHNDLAGRKYRMR